MYKGLQKEVLIVEDEGSIRQLLSEFLSLNGYKVILAKNAYEALEIVENNACSLMITDMHMPLLNGIELVKRIRKINISLPIIGMSIENNKAEFLEAGANYFLLKPFSLNRLKFILYTLFTSPETQATS